MFSDEKLTRMTVHTRLLFIALITMADDCGRLLDSVTQIFAFMHPLEDAPEEFARLSREIREGLATLSTNGQIARGKTASGQSVIQIVHWTKHQYIDRPNVKRALPEIVATEDVAKAREIYANNSRNIREDFATDSMQEGDREEDRDREEESSSSSARAREDDSNPDERDLLEQFSPEDRTVVLRFLDEVRDRRSPWIASLRAMLSGRGSPGDKSVSPAAIARGLGDFLASAERAPDRRISASHVRSFIAKAHRELADEALAGESVGRLTPALIDHARELQRLIVSFGLSHVAGRQLQERMTQHGIEQHFGDIQRIGPLHHYANDRTADETVRKIAARLQARPPEKPELHLVAGGAS